MTLETIGNYLLMDLRFQVCALLLLIILEVFLHHQYLQEIDKLKEIKQIERRIEYRHETREVAGLSLNMFWGLCAMKLFVRPKKFRVPFEIKIERLSDWSQERITYTQNNYWTCVFLRLLATFTLIAGTPWPHILCCYLGTTLYSQLCMYWGSTPPAGLLHKK